MTEKVIVTMADVRAVHLCSGGARKFFQRYGLSYSEFLRDGIEAQRLIDTGDALARTAVEHAQQRTEKGA